MDLCKTCRDWSPYLVMLIVVNYTQQYTLQEVAQYLLLSDFSKIVDWTRTLFSWLESVLICLLLAWFFNSLLCNESGSEVVINLTDTYLAVENRSFQVHRCLIHLHGIYGVRAVFTSSDFLYSGSQVYHAP